MLQIAQRSALRSGNPKALNVITTKMPGTEEFGSHTLKVRKCLALRSVKRTYSLDLDMNLVGLTKWTSPIHESGQGLLQLWILVAVWVTSRKSLQPICRSIQYLISIVGQFMWPPSMWLLAQRQSGTLLGCQRLQLRLVLPKKPLWRRTTR